MLEAIKGRYDVGIHGALTCVVVHVEGQELVDLDCDNKPFQIKIKSKLLITKNCFELNYKDNRFLLLSLQYN
jgi:hypothetical protein